MVMGTLLASRPPTLQPLVLCHGRVQRLQLMTSMRNFGKPPHLPAPCLLLPTPLAQPASLAAQQLQAVWGCKGTATAALTTPASQLIQPGEVHIWWLDPASIGAELELQRCSQLLTDEELQDCTTSNDAAVRRERLLARALVRSVLPGYLPGGTHPHSLLFERNSHGKPRLLWPRAMHGSQMLHFNLTHTTTLIGLAVTVEGLVGIDVEGEGRRTRSDPLRLARRHFSDGEIADLKACLDDDSRAARFLQLWTLKEAYVKALGRGISAPPGLRSFSFRLSSWSPQQDGVNGCLHEVDSEPQANTWHGIPDDSTSTSTSTTSTASSRSSSGNSSSSTIKFHTAASDLRCWDFALLQPGPGHMAALCVERHSSSTDSSQHGQHQPLKLLQFKSLLDSSKGHPVHPHLLAQGTFP